MGDYKKKYNDLIDRLRKAIEDNDVNDERYCCVITDIVPELKESEDERIRKAIHIYLDWLDGRKDYAPKGEYSIKDMIVWLEKQGVPVTINIDKMVEDYANNKECGNEGFGKPINCMIRAYRQGLTDAIATLNLRKQGVQKPFDYENANIQQADFAPKVEPRFKVGDWIIQENIGVYKVIEVCESWYEVVDNKDKHYSIGFDKEYMCRLWTIQDAKDGDVLATEDWVFIFEKMNSNGKPTCYCHYDIELGFRIDTNSYIASGSEIYPATKEQRDLLFQKMHEAGYKWDAEKKELKKIEQKPQRIVSAEVKEAMYDKPAEWSEDDERNRR